jgi:hypothetical protein
MVGSRNLSKAALDDFLLFQSEMQSGAGIAWRKWRMKNARILTNTARTMSIDLGFVHTTEFLPSLSMFEFPGLLAIPEI